jgi:hypothetical protein
VHRLGGGTALAFANRVLCDELGDDERAAVAPACQHGYERITQ